tara:strand:+ start:224 stop:523 length:300 start_codon:yes stop_codon:yes gene_type:complete
MPKATQTLSFIDTDQSVKSLSIVVNDDYSVDVDWVDDKGNAIEAPPPPKETLGDKAERLIDGLTGGKLKKCGGCARRKAMLDKLGALNEQVTETARNVD